MTPRTLSVLIVVLLINIFAACNLGAVYDDNISFENAQWEKSETARFQLNIADSLSQYDFYINLRNTADYRFQNLYIFLTTHFPNKNVTRDTIEFILADQTGRWLGKGWGNLKEHDILLKSNLTFPLSGDYTFLIQHAMRVDTLNGINNIGVRIEKSK